MKPQLQATFQSWPPKPDVDWASSAVKGPSLAHLSSYPPTRLSSTAQWSTALPSGLTPVSHVLFNLMLWKQRPSISLESLAMKPSLWAYHFAIANRSVVSLCLLPPHVWTCTLCPFCALSPQVAAGRTRSTRNPVPVKLPKSRITAYLHSFVPLFPHL